MRRRPLIWSSCAALLVAVVLVAPSVEAQVRKIATTILGPGGQLTVSSSAVTSTVPVVGPSGSIGSPSFEVGQAGVGMYRKTSGTGSLVSGSFDILTWNASLVTSAVPIQVDAGASFDLVSKAFIRTAPTVTSAGTSPSVTASNGTAAFRVNVGTGGTATTIVMAMPAATTGWNCFAENLTAGAANRANQRVVMQSSTTTSITVQNQTISTGAALAFTASDIVAFICTAY